MQRGTFARRRLERQLIAVRAELVSVREELGVASEQLIAFRDDDDDAHTRMLVSDQVGDRYLSDVTHRQAEVMNRSVVRARAWIAELEKRERDLLLRYQPGGATDYR